MNRKSKFVQPITALYCRLSIEDGRDNESMSISNQYEMDMELGKKMKKLPGGGSFLAYSWIVKHIPGGDFIGAKE